MVRHLQKCSTSHAEQFVAPKFPGFCSMVFDLTLCKEPVRRMGLGVANGEDLELEQAPHQIGYAPVYAGRNVEVRQV